MDGLTTEPTETPAVAPVQPDRVAALEGQVEQLRRDNQAQLVQFLQAQARVPAAAAAPPVPGPMKIDESGAPSPDEPGKFAGWVAAQVAAQVVPAVDARVNAAAQAGNAKNAEAALLAKLKEQAGAADLDNDAVVGVVHRVAEDLRAEGFDPAALLNTPGPGRQFLETKITTALQEKVKAMPAKLTSDVAVETKTVGTGGRISTPGVKPAAAGGAPKTKTLVEAIKEVQSKNRLY